jgi:hypothetical protein
VDLGIDLGVIKEYNWRKSQMNRMIALSFAISLLLVLATPTHGIVWCHDFTLYAVTGADHNETSVQQLRTILGTRGYKLCLTLTPGTAGEDAMLKPGDVIVIGNAHSGVVNARGLVDHFRQRAGAVGKRYQPNELGALENFRRNERLSDIRAFRNTLTNYATGATYYNYPYQNQPIQVWRPAANCVSARQIKSLTVAPDDAQIKVGETKGFSAIVTYEDNTTEDVTAQAAWSGGSDNSFTGKAPGAFSITAKYANESAGAKIKVACPDDRPEWNAKLAKCISLDSAIDEVGEGEEEPRCDEAETLSQNFGGLWATADGIASDFMGHYQKFFKVINDQNSNPCRNNLLAVSFAGSQRLLTEYSGIVDELGAVATNLLIWMGLCPDLSSSSLSSTVKFLTSQLGELSAARGAMAQRLQEMRAQLNRFGCDEKEVTERGDELAENTGDPNVIDDGGSGGKEICGDGIDNDGDGLQDEDCTGQGGFNVTIYLFDSGSAKDDVFGLSVTGQGNLGNTPAGGARTYPLSLAPGTYTATVTVISAPDNIGTFTVTVSEGDKVIASQTGGPSQGTQVQVPFTVGQAGTGSGASFAFPLMDFINEIPEEGIPKRAGEENSGFGFEDNRNRETSGTRERLPLPNKSGKPDEKRPD